MKESECDNTESVRRSAIENGKIRCDLGDFEVVDDGIGDPKGASICPITPIPRRKDGESILVMSTPLSMESTHSKIPEYYIFNSTSSDEDSPRTPEQGVFNPFAPGPEEMCLAPLCKKVGRESKRIVARRLDFDAEDDRDVEIGLETMLLETVYATLLEEAILLKQAEDFLAENQGLELSGCSTPTSPLPLSGISETCPMAPAKTTARKSVNIDPGLCRKLEF